MTEPTESSHDQHVQITDGGHTMADAEVDTSDRPHGTANVVLHAEHGPLPAGTRADLVDAVLNLPGVRQSDHLRAYTPLGDSESMNRLRERTTNMRTHAAGCTAVIDAELIAPCDCSPPRLNPVGTGGIAESGISR